MAASTESGKRGGLTFEVIEVLKFLNQEVKQREDAVYGDVGVGEVADEAIDHLDRADDALRDIIFWINERTGIDRMILREVAHRAGSPFGLNSSVSRKTGQVFEDRQELYGRLRMLDRDPGTLDAFRSILSQHGLLDDSRTAPKKKRGRPRQYDQTSDRRIATAWASRQYSTLADLARELELDEREVKKAIDRDRHRRRR